MCEMYSVCVVNGPAPLSLVWRVAWFSWLFIISTTSTILSLTLLLLLQVVKVFFEPNSTTVVEGESAKLIVLADKDFDCNFTVNVSTMDDTATGG